MARFIFGFLIGATASAAVVYFTAPRSGTAQREQLKSLWDGAKEAAREASDTRTQELWSDYRARLKP
jgi:gas vesicle protein